MEKLDSISNYLIQIRDIMRVSIIHLRADLKNIPYWLFSAWANSQAVVGTSK